MGCEQQREAFQDAQAAVDALRGDWDTANQTLKTTRQALAQCEESSGQPNNGLPQFALDNHVRISTRAGVGSGNLIGTTATSLLFETNYHVAGRTGSRVTVEIWAGGDPQGSFSGTVTDHWFDANRSKDVSIVSVPKTVLEYEPTPVPYVDQDDYEPKVGDLIYTGACMQGLSPRPRSSNVLKVAGGLVYSLPNSIGGDSGSALHQWVDGKLVTVGRLAWSLQTREWGWVCLSMSAKRVNQIKRGEVATLEDILPTGWCYPGDVPANAPAVISGEACAL